MSGTPAELLRAAEEAKIARARLTATVAAIQDRLQPRELVREGVERLRERGEDLAERTVAAARANPAAAATAGTAFLLFLLRRPLGRLAARIFSRKKARSPAALHQDDPFDDIDIDSNALPRA